MYCNMLSENEIYVTGDVHKDLTQLPDDIITYLTC